MPDLSEYSEFAARRERLQSSLSEWRVEAFVITAAPNVHYLSGFTGSNGAVLLLPERALLLTDPRYATQAPQQSDCEVKVARGPLLAEAAKWVKRRKLRTLGFEENRISYEDYSQLHTVLRGVRLKPLNGAVETIRMTKSPAEIGTITASVRLNSVALEQALEHFHSSITEVDLAAEIEYRMRLLGADGTAFDTIVASGPRTALPHAHPTNNPVQPDQLLLIDMGASVAGYASDMTRTYALGKLNAKIRRMYKAVLESQLAAIDAVRPGITCSYIDRTARDVLSGYGFDKLFVHSTGHGLGLEIHERPRIGRKERTKLQPGMVITVEPGVYQEGVGGIRIEDTVLVTTTGCAVLTSTGKELVVL
ncbi:MAG TPA: Xaa-Pro peptidase family protein [Bryobacteraceae bacterium]|jgi:Xaa-Pro aminopeptidase|nr:Xaa-Pro peptidase family protein [Bryobacteraceae bacterium]